MIGAVAIAQAAIPDNGGTIHGCYQKESGDLRVVDDPSTCSNAETSLSWSQTGPQGPTGPTGATGPQGIQGPPGTNDLFASHNRASVVQDENSEVVGLSNLPVGTYLIRATVNIQQFDCEFFCSDPFVRCFFVDQNGEFLNGYNVVFAEAAYHRQVIYPLTAIRTFSTATNTIRVLCNSDDDAKAFGEITALKVTPAGVKP